MRSEPPHDRRGVRTRSESTRNYELNKTVSHTRNAPGRIARVSAAVVLDDRLVADAEGVLKPTPLPPEELDAAVDAFVANLQKGAYKAICATKKTVNLGLKQLASAVMDASIAYETLTVATRDHAEGVHAFLEKREPKFIGK